MEGEGPLQSAKLDLIGSSPILEMKYHFISCGWRHEGLVLETIGRLSHFDDGSRFCHYLGDRDIDRSASRSFIE
jgi:hypothetical protein